MSSVLFLIPEETSRNFCGNREVRIREMQGPAVLGTNVQKCIRHVTLVLLHS